MKLITCMIQPGKLPEVKQALFDAQVNRMTVFNALGAGQQGGHKETYRGVQYEINLLKKVRLDTAVNEDFVEATIEAIIGAACTGSIGDGKIFVTSLDECVHIRTGERGVEAVGE
ncbi:MAG: P-II family nitrogen regulator [Acidobacteriota bacterium]|nr:P-II family nitrogen regulator [Acidobacteriota bacterium]